MQMSPFLEQEFEERKAGRKKQIACNFPYPKQNTHKKKFLITPTQQAYTVERTTR